MNNRRTQWIDALKGYGIVLVVFGHCITYLENPGYPYELIWKYIASFNMPLFFMISGYLYKTSDGGFKNCFLRKMKAMGIPFLVASVLFIPLGYLRAKMTGGRYSVADDIKYVISFSTFGYTLNGVTWFLVALFWIYIIHYILSEKCKLSANQSVLVGIVTFIIAWNTPGLNYIPLGRWKVILTQYLIFALGYFVKQNQLEKKCKRIFWLEIIAGLTLAIAFNETVAVSNAIYKNVIVFLFAAVLSCLGYLSLFRELFERENTTANCLAVLGRYSLFIMCTHIPIMYIARVILSSKETPIIVFALIMVAEMGLVRFIMKFEKKKG